MVMSAQLEVALPLVLLYVPQHSRPGVVVLQEHTADGALFSPKHRPKIFDVFAEPLFERFRSFAANTYDGLNVQPLGTPTKSCTSGFAMRGHIVIGLLSEEGDNV